MTSLLVDTVVVVDHIRSSEPLRTRGNRLFYSVVTRAELYMGGNERAVDRILRPLDELPMDRDVAERAGRLRWTMDIGFPDAVIAATALEHGLTLITRNVRDFEDVPKLKVRTEVP